MCGGLLEVRSGLWWFIGVFCVVVMVVEVRLKMKMEVVRVC
jgi:hypothetical protein